MRVLLFSVCLAAAAHASSVTDEVGVNSTQSSDTNPRSGSVSDSLNASFDLGESWSINAGAMVTVEGQTPAAARGEFGNSGSAISTFYLGVDWDLNDHWTLGANGNWSPMSTQTVGTQLTLGPNGGVLDNALLQSQSSQLAGGIDVSYDTAGESDLEVTLTGAVTETDFQTDQRVTRIRTAAGGTLTAAQLRTLCNNGTLKCGGALLTALKETPATLDSQRFSGSATATAWRDTDFTLAVDWYHYQQDPAEVGYFSIAATGRSVGGNGVPIAPLKYLVRPEVLHRFGGFSVKLWVQAGKYEAGTGDSTAGAGLKLQYKFSKAFRLWVTASGQHDVDEQGNQTQSGAFALGAGYRF